MLFRSVVGIALASLSGIEQNLVLVRFVLAYEGAAARGRNHLVAIEPLQTCRRESKTGLVRWLGQ